MIRRLTGDEVGQTLMDPAKVQAIASALGQLLIGVSELLVVVHSSLGVPPEMDQIGDEGAESAEADSIGDEGAEPTLQLQLRGDLEILVNETLPSAIAILGGIASETEDSLRAMWQQRSLQGKKAE